MTQINATPETIRGTATALGKARLLDDKIGNADQSRIVAWAEEIEHYNLGLQDLLAGVGTFYCDNPTGRTLQVGDLIHHARLIRRERTEREDDAYREARQAILDAKIAEDDDEPEPYAGPVKHHRPVMNWMAIRCPHCGASPFKHCHVPGAPVRPHGGTHPARLEAAHDMQAEGLDAPPSSVVEAGGERR